MAGSCPMCELSIVTQTYRVLINTRMALYQFDQKTETYGKSGECIEYGIVYTAHLFPQ